jgi:predicted PilT family ATPase
MATADVSANQAEDKKKLRDEWLENLSHLVETMRVWAQELDWSTRLIEKKMEESRLGTYKAPALILQKETVRVMLEPIARFATGVEGVVDLYLMPAYDDIASLYFYDDGWQLHYKSPASPTANTIREVEHKPLSKESLQEILEEMIKNAE